VNWGGTTVLVDATGVPCRDAQGRIIACPPGALAGLGARLKYRHYRPRGVPPLAPNPVVAGLGAAYQGAQGAPAASIAPAADPSIAMQLNQISVDWPSGTLHIGTNKYSILTTLIGGLIVKGIMWGLSKGGSAIKGGGTPAVAAKKAR